MNSYPIIVLDGPDGVGKSTLAEVFKKELGAHVTHLTYRWKTKMFDYHSAGLFNCLYHSQSRPVVLDRWWPSEVVYADAYRGGSKWPLAHRMFEKAALKHCIIYLFCLPFDRDAYLKHYNVLKGKRVEMYDEGMERVYDGFIRVYDRLAVHGRPNVWRYDYTEHSLESLPALANDMIERSLEWRKAQWKPALDINFKNFTGHVNSAEFVLVGDQLKPKTRREVWPFFEYGNSSLWLAETLESLDIPEHKLIHINAAHETDGADLFIKEFGHNFRYIAMGAKAAQYLDGHDLDYYRTHHPQYYRRFSRMNGVDAYREAFK